MLNTTTMPAVIDFFDAPPFDWLSNFYPCLVRWDGATYRTTEAAFQAAKTDDWDHRIRIYNATTPGQAKALGQRYSFEKYKVVIRPDWDEIKFDVMHNLCSQKFHQPGFREKLLATGGAMLIEGNTWGDRIWGVVNGVGENHLGKTLMRIRAGLRGEVCHAG